MEEEKEHSPSLRELQEELSDWTALREHRGFTRLQRTLSEQCHTIIADTLLAPIATLDSVPAQEFKKGEATALRRAMHLADDMVLYLQEQIKEILEKEDRKHEPDQDDAGR